MVSLGARRVRQIASGGPLTDEIRVTRPVARRRKLPVLQRRFIRYVAIAPHGPPIVPSSAAPRRACLVRCHPRGNCAREHAYEKPGMRSVSRIFGRTSPGQMAQFLPNSVLGGAAPPRRSIASRCAKPRPRVAHATSPASGSAWKCFQRRAGGNGQASAFCRLGCQSERPHRSSRMRNEIVWPISTGVGAHPRSQCEFR